MQKSGFVKVWAEVNLQLDALPEFICLPVYLSIREAPAALVAGRDLTRRQGGRNKNKEKNCRVLNHRKQPQRRALQLLTKHLAILSLNRAETN